MKQRIKDYVLTTFYLWGAYSLGLTPAAFLLWLMTFEQWLIWLLSSIPLNLLLNYPIGRIYTLFRQKYIT